jgi:hypothetical protein
MKKVKITIAKDGTERIEVLGAAGDECLAFTRDLERRLGSIVGERTLKPESSDGHREREGERPAQREERS